MFNTLGFKKYFLIIRIIVVTTDIVSVTIKKTIIPPPLPLTPAPMLGLEAAVLQLRGCFNVFFRWSKWYGKQVFSKVLMLGLISATLIGYGK